SGTLPSGCTLPTTGNSAFTGTASGVSSNTNYTWTIKVTDTSGGTATQDYQQTINTVAPTVTGGTVTISSVSEGGSASYDVDTDFTFGTGSTFSAYSLQSGSLPSGTSLATATGVISGTAGNVSSNTAYTFTIRGTDTDGDTVDQSYSWTINTITPTSTGGTVTISNTSEGASASYDVDTNFSYPTGSTFSAYSLQSGSLPNGLSLNTTSGVISGTAGNSGSASFTIRATDTDGDVKDQAYSWTITNVAPTSTGGTVTISSVQEGLSASYDVDTNFTFTTGSTFSAYSLLSGSLPSGLSLNTSTGVISGTMGAVSSNTAYSFSIRGTDTNGDYVDQAYSWTITDTPFSATGGTITNISGYRVHTFTSSASGASGFVPNKAGSVDVLVVAGGGGGGAGTRHNGAWSAGGGAGGVLYSSSVSVSQSSYSITVGAGGGINSNGANSIALGMTAIGGGRGGGSAGYVGASGGSGGGGIGDENPARAGGSGTSGQGNAGGPGTDPGGNPYYEQGGGGGGAGEVGNTDGLGYGGDGESYANTFGTTYGESGYFGGGGAGGSGTDNSGSTNEGGLGGGGDTSGGYQQTLSTQSGASNTGGGGSLKASGGSGIVIIRYAV
ncbi:MAG: hypothetical protein HOE35_02825, partial [Candidatus Ruthia sp.]|nr:hypothetical protein [Candidatus Ruthturnera sp.]